MVLIIDTSRLRAQSICDIFYYMGVLSYPTIPQEAFSEISGAYRCVLISHPEKLPDAVDFVERLRSYNSSIPIFSISDEPLPKALGEAFDSHFPESIYSSTLVESIALYQAERRKPITGIYRLAGIDASCTLRAPQVFDRPIPFTKTETMILRYLISSYPEPKETADILRFAFKPSRKPEITSIRTHVSVMNKKFREIRGKNLIINIPTEGYIVSTPEILSSLKEAT